MAGYIHNGLKNILSKHPGDIVILSALRTPFTRSKKGSLKDAYPEELLSAVLKATLASAPDLPPSLIQDVTVGTVLQELGGAKAGRMSAIHAGIPAGSSTFSTVNRQCASSLSAITSVAHSIAVRAIDIGIAAGMESMSRNYGSRAIPTVLWPDLSDSAAEKDTRDCIMPMGLTSENVASRYNVSREDQDVFAAESHAKAATAQKAGWFNNEIIPVTTRWTPPPDKEHPDIQPAEEEVTAMSDDGIRPTITASSLAKLKPAFSDSGSSTAGNSSQITDGASAVLLLRRDIASKLGLESQILGKWAGSSLAGCAPDEMGIGPAVAIPKLLDAAQIRQEDVQLWELNEAFASQTLYCIRALGLEGELERGRVNPKGGAIALGHPLGATGARLVACLLHELRRRDLTVGVVSMCMSTGMGMAGLFVRE